MPPCRLLHSWIQVGRMDDRLVGRSVKRLVGRSVERSVGRSVGWSVYRSIGRSVGRSIGRLVGPSHYLDRNRSIALYRIDRGHSLDHDRPGNLLALTLLLDKVDLFICRSIDLSNFRPLDPSVCKFDELQYQFY